MAELQCQVILPIGGENAKAGVPPGQSALSVGRIFNIDCQGMISKLNPEKTELRLEATDKYKLKLLGIQQESSGLKLTVTSYVAGPHQLKAVQIVDPENSHVLSPLEFTVATVIQQTEAKVEAFGPRGPMKIHLPWHYYAIWAVIIAGIVFLAVQKLRQRNQRNRLLKELDQYGTSLTPYHQFTQSTRRFQREYQFLSVPDSVIELEKKAAVLAEFEKSYRLFLGRTFQVPSLHWKDGKILKGIKENNASIHKLKGTAIEKTLHEFSQAKIDIKVVAAKDLQQLLGLIRKNVDEIFILLKAEDKV